LVSGHVVLRAEPDSLHDVARGGDPDRFRLVVGARRQGELPTRTGPDESVGPAISSFEPAIDSERGKLDGPVGRGVHHLALKLEAGPETDF